MEISLELIIATISVGTVIVTLIYHANEVRQSKIATYATILSQTMKDLYELYRNEDNLETKHECEVHVTRWLDCLSVVTNLHNKRNLDKDLLKFMKYDLEIAKRYMLWFDEHGLGKQYNSNANGIWTNLKTYFDKNSINTSSDETLAEPLKNFKDLP